MKITVTEGRWYTGTIKLNFVQKAASNDTICKKLRSLGFDRVTCYGTGGTRTAKGKWMRKTQTVELPSQIGSVREVEA